MADELVSEYFDSLSMPLSDSEKQTYDMKNIRRRVYDALNVLMAMNIIEKEKKVNLFLLSNFESLCIFIKGNSMGRPTNFICPRM